MAHSISKEDLKEALLELVQSDSKFVASLLAEMVSHLPSVAKSENPQKQVRSQKGNPSPKVIPSYRQDIKKMYPEAGLSEKTIAELRELFADGPSSEQIISTLRN